MKGHPVHEDRKSRKTQRHKDTKTQRHKDTKTHTVHEESKRRKTQMEDASTNNQQLTLNYCNHWLAITLVG